MKFLKKRLPALLLALIIAVMPTFLAIPGHADSGIISEPGTYFTGSVDLPVGSAEVRFSAPLLLDRTVIVYDALGELHLFTFDSSAFYVSSSGPQSDVYAFSIIPLLGSSDTCVHYVYYLPPSELTSSISVDFIHREDLTISVNDPFELVAIALFADFDPPFSSGFNLLTLHSAPDVTIPSVFSGVASWFAGAVGSASSMFWTAEGGLTVLGVLAVASLAIAVIILLIYLLAGWLKFK